MKARLLAFLLTVAFAQVVFAQRYPAAYTRYLLPFHGSIPGAGGYWFTEWWFRNEGSTAADVFPLTFGCFCPPGVTSILRAPSLPASSTLLGTGSDVVPPFFYNSATVPLGTPKPGAIIYVQTSARSNIDVHGQLRWISYGRTSPAVAVDAIPEQQFVRGTRSVLPVLVAANVRYSVRIYALPESSSNRTVTVHIIDMQPNPSPVNGFAPREELLWSTTAQLQVPPDDRLSCSSCDVPAVPYRAAVAELFNVPVLPAHGEGRSVRFEIVPSSTDLRYWAIVSTTDNGTNAVHLYPLTR